MWAAEALWGRSLPVLAASMVLGLAACYAVGTAWYMVLYARTAGPVGIAVVLGRCVVPFLLPDLGKLLLALALQRRLGRAVR